MNRKKWLVLIWFILAGFILMQYTALEFYQPDKLTFWDVIMFPLGNLFTGLTLLFLYVIPVFDYSAKFIGKRKFLILTLAGLFYGLVFSCLLFLFPAIKFEGNYTQFFTLMKKFIMTDFHNVLKNYLFQIAILYAFEYIRKETNWINAKKNLEIELNQTKLQILKSQLQPHFLFNALNSVVSVIDENKQKAQEMLVNLSDLLRTTLNADFKQLIPLYKEIEYIENYLSIEKIRYEDQLDYQITVDKKSANLKVPSLILQPIVENAIKHGFIGIQRPLQLIIVADANDKTIIVKNNGARFVDGDSSFGLKNVKERLSIYYPGQNSFRIYQDEEWTINKIKLG